MAHSLSPSTNYQLVTLTVAVAVDDTDEAADALNESLRNLVNSEEIADYTFHSMSNVTSKKTGIEPEEGELFSEPLYVLSEYDYKTIQEIQTRYEAEEYFEIEELLDVINGIEINK